MTMISRIQQILLLIRVNLLSIPRRLAISLSMAISVALVVCVLAGFLAMAKGFETALIGTGSPTVAVMLGGGTNQEMGSQIPATIVRAVKTATTDIGVTRTPEGNTILSRELVVPVDIARKHEGALQTVSLRGMDVAGISMRDGLRLTGGQLFALGSRELMLGDALARKLGYTVGDVVRIGSLDWRISGQFATQSSVFESEIWAAIEAVQMAFRRQGEVQSLRLRLVDPASLSALEQYASTMAQTPLVLVTEAELYASQAGGTADLIRLFGWPLAGLMAVGATAGALNTMMSSVSDRTVEIATVRALGFGRGAAFFATWVEACALAGAGATVGIVVSWMGLNGLEASTLGVNQTQIMFQLTTDAEVMALAVALGFAIGAIGGAAPAFMATRLPIAAALRS